MSAPIPQCIRERLENLSVRRVQAPYKRVAAVLMPIFLRGNEPHFLLTKRTDAVQTHKGQVSFPGGMIRKGEDLARAALRETFEEIGIEAASVEILGQYHEYLSSTEFRVVPFAGFIAAEFHTRPQPEEVAEILEVPFHVFRDPSLFRIETWERDGRKLPVYFYTFGRHEIWGLTARIIKDFLEEVHAEFMEVKHE